VSANPVFFVDGPRPVVPTRRLLDVPGVRVPVTDNHALLGIRVWPHPTDVPVGWDPCSEGTFRPKDSASANPESPEFSPVVAVAVEACSTFTVHNQTEYQDRVRAVLEAGLSQVAEQVLISGPGGTAANPYVAETTNLLNGGAAVNPATGLAAIENELASTFRDGLIIADPATATAWAAQYLVFEDSASRTLRTAIGTPVAVANGAVDAHPDTVGAPAFAHSWAWAVGPTRVLVGDIEIVADNVKESLDREINLIEYRAEASLIPYWDNTFAAAVQIDWSTA